MASTELRLGREEAVGAYEAHGRVSGGGRPEVLERLYQSWKADVAVGKSSLMIAPDTATVAELNRRARPGPGRRRRGPGGRCGAGRWPGGRRGRRGGDPGEQPPPRDG